MAIGDNIDEQGRRESASDLSSCDRTASDPPHSTLPREGEISKVDKTASGNIGTELRSTTARELPLQSTRSILHETSRHVVTIAADNHIRPFTQSVSEMALVLRPIFGMFNVAYYPGRFWGRSS